MCDMKATVKWGATQDVRLGDEGKLVMPEQLAKTGIEGRPRFCRDEVRELWTRAQAPCSSPNWARAQWMDCPLQLAVGGHTGGTREPFGRETAGAGRRRAVGHSPYRAKGAATSFGGPTVRSASLGFRQISLSQQVLADLARGIALKARHADNVPRNLVARDCLAKLGPQSLAIEAVTNHNGDQRLAELRVRNAEGCAIFDAR